MKHWKTIAGGLLMSAGLSLTGCHGDLIIDDHHDHHRDYNDDVIYVRESPPPNRVEVISVSPGADYYWIDGDWAWRDRWIWRDGSWGRRPHQNAVWVRSRWSQERGGWGYHKGEWKH